MRNLGALIKKSAGLFLLMTVLSAAALAQAGRGSLFMRGVVCDHVGSLVAGARIKAVLDGRPDIVRETMTDEKGKWNLLYLKKGTWLVTAFTAEMSSALTDVLLKVNRSDITLPLTRSAAGILIEAKTAIYQEDFNKALQILTWFVSNFPDSRELGSALFWISHVYDQLSRSQKDREKAMGLLTTAIPYLDRLISDFPRSEWKDDAEIRRIELALRLYQWGRPQYAEIIEKGLANENRSEIDVRLAALDALTVLDRSRAIRVLSGIVLGDPDPGIRTKAVMILGKTGLKDAFAILEKVAVADTDPGVRRAAAIWRGR